MTDFLDQREALAQQRLKDQIRGTGSSYRMMQDAIRQAAFGRYVLVLVENRRTVIDLGNTVPYELNGYLTIRCIDSHPDVNWKEWSVPGWENHSLYVDHQVLEKQFPNLSRMMKY